MQFLQTSSGNGHHSSMAAFAFFHGQGVLAEIDILKSEFENLGFPKTGTL